MKPNRKKMSRKRSVPYYGQKPHAQGKPPHPLMCFSWNVRNAFRRAFTSLQDAKKKKKEKSRVECLMDLFSFDVNQLLIYENRNEKCKKECVLETLRLMKLRVDEVKSLAASSKCLENAETMLKKRERLKCVSRSFRRQLIEHMANYDPSKRSSRIMCKMMKELDGIDADIFSLCKCVKDKPEECCTDLIEESLYNGQCQENKIPDICTEVMRPYDPKTDEDADSIHLRYVPELGAFKAGMARNPTALRLPLMCPAMKKIMNTMKPSYLLDDVPYIPACDPSPKTSTTAGRTLTVGFVQYEQSLDRAEDESLDGHSFNDLQTDSSHSLEDNCISNLWLVVAQQLCQI